MALTLVTAFYKIYDSCKTDYVDQFLKIVTRGYPIIVFADEASLPTLAPLKEHSNVTIRTDLLFDQLAAARLFPSTCQLPANRSETKDTYEYLVLMNSKIEFMRTAANQTTKIAWIDFGICKLIKDLPAMFKKLDNVTVPEGQILIPGCHEPYPSNPDNVHWRFCGSLLFAGQEAIERLYEASLTHLSETRRLTWEVNVWAQVEAKLQQAQVEAKLQPPLFAWYKGDHNDTIFDFPITKRVMAIIMIKNEERIIKRCIERALAIADAICIADTGSTDSTVALLTEYLPTLQIPAKLFQHTWQDFGHNRTLSFKAAQEFVQTLGWEPDFTYGLAIDADMNFVVTPKFNKASLTANGYRIMQKTPGLEYYNTRFLRLGYPWTCRGVTHEYWDGSDTEQLDTVYIDDIGDGGCKADKFERDARLLTKGLEEEPTNARYMFYLAQTLKDGKRLDEAIALYKRRIEAGGWYEEVWYSMYIISKLYHEQNKLPEMEFWALKAYEFNKNRSENLYFLTRVFRERSEHYKAWFYMQKGLATKKSGDLLFLENEVYEHLFLYEKTILNYYIQPHKQTENLQDLISYYNLYGTGVYSNLEHYVQPIQHVSVSTLPLAQIGDYIATSTSFVNTEEGVRLNIRYVNYRIQPDGSYKMMVDGVLSHDNPVRTRNFTAIADNDLNLLTAVTEEMLPASHPLHNGHIQGLEDLRLYQDGSKMKWIATSMEYSHNGAIGQVGGTYDLATHTLTEITPYKSPFPTQCEKNWIPLVSDRVATSDGTPIPLVSDEFIYSWHPFRIGRLDETNTLQIVRTQSTPRFFEHMRGSSNVVSYNNALYALTHIVMYTSPRKYYHQLVRLSMDRKVEAYTLPFYFRKNTIEYCLGIMIDQNQLKAIVSQYDRDPIVVRIAWDSLRFYGI